MDPWDFAVDEVVQHLCYSDDLFVALPNSRRPNAAHFESSLRENDVDGFTLLTVTDLNVLRHELGIKSLGERASIQHAIDILRSRSPKYHAIHAPPRSAANHLNAITQTQSPAQTPPQKRDVSPEPNLESPSTPRARPGEVLIEDGHGGRKRRKLHLVAEPQPPKTVVTPREAPQACLGIGKILVDGLFFDTSVNARGPQHDSDDEDEDSDNFTISQLNEAPYGRRQFIHRRMRYFLQHPFLEDERGHRIRTPYPNTIQTPGRASHVIHFELSGNVVEVSQRNSAMLDHPIAADETGKDGVSDEWDYLAKNWANDPAGDTELGPLGESGDEDGFDGSIADEIEAEEAEEKARADNKHQFLSKDDVAIAIDDAVQALEQKWDEDKLPKRQASAWSVWRKGRGYRRSNIMHAARQDIERLDTRLEKLKKSICDEVWKDLESVQKQCACMEVTVWERKEQRWRLALWENPQAPVRQAMIPRLEEEKKPVQDFDADEESLLSESEGAESVENFIDIDDAYKSLRSRTEIPSSDALLADDLPASGTDHVHHKDDDSDLPTTPRQQSPDSVIDPTRTQTEWASVPSHEIIDLTHSSPAASSPREAGVVVEEQDLSEDDDSLAEASEAANEQAVIFDNHPENATEEQIKQWPWAVLAERSDRNRIMIKLLHNTNPDLRRDVDKLFLPQHDKVLKAKVLRGLGAIKRRDTHVQEVSESENIAVHKVSRLFICWTSANHRYDAGTVVKDVMNKALKLAGFTAFYELVKSLVAVVNASSDEEPGTPHKKRKRGVLKDRQGLMLRETAQQRRLEGEERHLKLRMQLQSDGLAENTNGVMINPTKTDEEAFIYINNHVASKMKPHQIEGVRFMWREIVTVDKASRQGCLLAHTMGLGKTMQTITLLVTIAEAGMSSEPEIQNQIPTTMRTSRSLILCPAGLIENWRDEFDIWQPRDTVNIGLVHAISATTKKRERLDVIQMWYDKGGVLILGYEMFRALVKNNANPKNGQPALTEEQHEMVRKQLLEGPKIVVGDEAHKLKNMKSRTSSAAKKFKTTSRIALTGSPLANNLEDYFAMIDWVAPGYLGDLTEFKAYYQEPIEEGTYRDSTKYQQRKSLKKLQALKSDIDPKVHRADISVLQHDLKQKTEFVIKIPLTRLQHMAYSAFVQSLLHNTDVHAVGNTRLLDYISLLALLCNHPSNFLVKLRERNAKKEEKAKTAKPRLVDDGATPPIEEVDVASLGLSDTMVQRQDDIFREENVVDRGGTNLSHKTAIVEQILILSKKEGDRVLIFSQHIPTLKYLERAIGKMQPALKTTLLDGETKMSIRLKMSKDFNAGLYDVFLISTRAGGLGLNIPGANRVILMDFLWNPTWEEQAVGRAYRLGQKKKVFVYHLVAAGTFEGPLHDITIFKRQLASRVVDSKNPNRSAMKVNEMLFEPREVAQEDVEQHRGLDSVMDALLSSEAGKAIRSLSTAETLHAESDEKLDEEELKEVEEMIKDDKLRRTDHQAWIARQPYQHRSQMAAYADLRNAGAVTPGTVRAGLYTGPVEMPALGAGFVRNQNGAWIGQGGPASTLPSGSKENSG